MDACFRNTKIKIAKSVIEKEYLENKSYTRKEIANSLFVREKEFEQFKEILFKKEDESYLLNPDFFKEIKGWSLKQQESSTSIEDTKNQFIEIFIEIKKDFNYRKKFEKLKPLFRRLHWYYLPVYQDLMITNRGINPEKNIDEYYDHFHSLEDLYNIISKPNHYWKTLKGDINLNQECNFAVYTNRWGHEDMYKVKRVYDGWYVSHLSINGHSTPDALYEDDTPGGAFVANFQQDYVDYPKSFHYILGRLWEIADENDMEIQELQEKLSDVALLVSQVEKTVKKYTPNWY